MSGAAAAALRQAFGVSNGTQTWLEFQGSAEGMLRALANAGFHYVRTQPGDLEVLRESLADAACRALPHEGGGSRLVYEDDGLPIADAVIETIAALGYALDRLKGGA